MFSLPEPLHPAVVHFPIALILIGTAVAVAAALLNRWHLPWTAAALLALGAGGAFVAAETGESAQEAVGELPPAAEHLLDEHEEWAERTEIAAGIAGGLALVAAALGAFGARGGTNAGAMAFGARTLAAAAALLACFCVYQTARRGGELVYDHGVGVKSAAGQQSAATANVGRDDD